MSRAQSALCVGLPHTAMCVLAAMAMTAAATGCRTPRVVPSPEARQLPVPSAEPIVLHPPAAPSIPVPALLPTLADPRLARVQSFASDHEWALAATALAEATAALPANARTAAEKCAWDYESGRLLSAAGQPTGAALAFDEARGLNAGGAASCALSTYATLRAAEAYLKVGDPALAAERARAVAAGSRVHADADLVLASALAAQGHALEAVPLWRAALAQNPKAWIDVALPLASALLESAGDPAASEARDLATRVIVEAPKIAETSGADGLRRRAVERLRVLDPKTPRELMLGQRAQQARVWLDAGEATRAVELATSLLKEPLLSQEPSVLCSISIVRAQALGRTKAGPGTSWDDAISRCEHDPALVTALYGGAKATAGKHPDLARTRYARVEALFHDHRLADDARFQGGLLALGQGDEPTFVRMMLTLPDDYPSGDQRTEALFRVALLRMTRGEWGAAGPLLDRIVELSPEDQHWATAGRAEYFRARVAAAEGQKDNARARYVRVLERHPFAYYMTQAYARLSEDDHELATRTLAAAFAREDTAPFLTSVHPELESVAFANARALLEVGDIDLARRELVASGVTRDDVDPEVAWTIALLYDRAGAVDVGHALARHKLRDYLTHYPVGAWKTKWEIAYPRAFDDLVVADSTSNGIPKALTWAIMREESDFVADARSGSAAFGLMQLIVPTAKGVARGTGLPSDEASLKQPTVNIALGTRLLGQLRTTFADNATLAIAAYNGGGGAVSRWIAARGDEPFDLWVEEIPWEETRGYEKRVLSSEAAYAYLYDPHALDEVLRISPKARGPARTRLTEPSAPR